MNGMNGHKNGASADAMAEWKMGLVNFEGKYLTAETFGFKINASGAVMKKKQMWTLEHDNTDEEVVFIKSHLGRYLSGDKKGNVTCEAEERGDDEKFVIEYEKDGSGRWALKNKQHNMYFGGSADNLRCYEKTPGRSEWWTARLAVHPQVNLKSVNRKKYAHLANEEIHIDELIPWGEDALLTIEYRDGKYAVKTCNNKYLHRNGSLSDLPNKDTLYSLEILSGQIAGMALKDCTGRYLTAVGPTGTMQSRDKPAKQDIVFTLEDSHPQCYITAHNGRKVSCKQGIDLAANQDEVEDTETFQIEWDKPSGLWRIRSHLNKYWSVENASGIQNAGNAKTGSGLFSFEYLDNGQVAIKANNNRYITAKLNGSLYATSDTIDSKEKFVLTLLNRPLLVLRCEYGFVGYKTPDNPRLECNKATYDIIYVEEAKTDYGGYYLKGANGKYLALDNNNNINADGMAPQLFQFEFRGQSKFYIKAPNGLYLRGEQNGITTATGADLSRATNWEF